MATSKILIDGVGIDLTSDTVTADKLASGYTAHDASGDTITGTLEPGIIPSGNVTFTAATFPVYDLDVYQYATAKIKPTPSEEKSTTTNGDVLPSEGYFLSKVSVNVPTGPSKSSADITVSGATVNVPAGLYSSDASKSVAAGTAGTPSATKGSVSGNSITVTPSVTNTTGYITGSTKTGTAVTVSASELVSGTKTITANGTTDVTNYANADVQVPIIVNDNWLDNWYMGDPVNQRGQTTYSGGSAGSYCIDRWMRATVITVDVNADNVAVTNTASGGYAFWQYLTNKLTIGVAYTISILYSSTASGNVMRLHDGSQYYCSTNLSASSTKTLASVTYTHTGENQISRFEVRPANNGTINIYAVKIELGTSQTLAHQENGEWVLDTIPNKTDEMHRCQTSTADINDNYANKILFPPNAITAGNTPVKFVAGYQYSTGSSLMEVSRITITRAGTYRFRWVANRGSSTGTYRTQLWKNGVAVSEEYTPSSTTWVGSYSVDVACSAGDYVCVYARGRSDSYPLGISGFTACINGDNGF